MDRQEIAKELANYAPLIRGDISIKRGFGMNSTKFFRKMDY